MQRHGGASIINSRKHKALGNIRSGKMTVPQAAEFAGVSLRSMAAWCRIAKIPVPAEDQPGPVRTDFQRKPR